MNIYRHGFALVTLVVFSLMTACTPESLLELPEAPRQVSEPTAADFLNAEVLPPIGNAASVATEGRLVYARELSLKAGQWQPFDYINRLALESGLVYVARMIPISGDPDLHLMMYQVENRWRKVRSSSTKGVEELTLRSTDFRPLDTHGVFWLQGVTDTRFRLEIFLEKTVPTSTPNVFDEN